MDGPFGSNLKTAHYAESGPRVIRLQNVGDGIFVDSEAHISAEHYQKLIKHAVSPGDIVVASLGTDLPRACLVPEWLGRAIVKADCFKFVVSKNLINASYIMHVLNSLQIRKRTEDLIHGVGRPRMGLTLFRQLVLPLPPLAEQTRIASEVDRLLSLESSLSNTVVKNTLLCDRIRQSILYWAFEGKLADQDPADEPASVLLERIRAEREAAADKTKPKALRRKA